jgi:hypothetical protein
MYIKRLIYIFIEPKIISMTKREIEKVVIIIAAISALVIAGAAIFIRYV